MKKYTTDKFLIGSWVSFYPFDTDGFEAQLDRMQGAGLNFQIFPMVFGGGMDTPEDCALIEQQYATRDMLYFMNGGLSDETMECGVANAQGKAHCIGYHLKDEPTGAELPEVGRFIRAYRKADEERYPFVNLLPSYAGPARLGGDYYEYCSRFVREAGAENIEYLSHDFYPFGQDSTNRNIFADMEVIRRVALENGRLRTHAFPQSSAWNGMRMPNIDEMRWNVYAYLAYGFKAFSWFNLVCPGHSDTEGEGFRESIIYRDGTIRDPQLFADFSALNHEVRALGDTIMRLDTIHAYHTQTTGLHGVESLPADWMITPDEAGDFVISHMVSRDGKDTYILIFNKSWESPVSSSFRVSWASGIETIEYVSPFGEENSTVTVQDGVFTENFRPGEGKLFKLNGKLSHRVLPLNTAHARLDIDLAMASSLIGVDVSCPLGERGMSVAIQLCTNKRFTEDKTTLHLFTELPEDGRLRFAPIKTKYIRMAFGEEDEGPADGYAEIRIRYADEPEVISMEPIVAVEEIIPDVTEADVIESEVEALPTETEPEIKEPEITEPEITESEITESEITESEITESEITEPEITEPEKIEPEIIEPDVMETEKINTESAVDYTDLNEAIEVVESLVAHEYTPESWQTVQNHYHAAVKMKEENIHSQEAITAAYWQLLEDIRELIPVQWVLPAPTSHTEPKDKQGLHVSKGVFPAAVAALAGAVTGAVVGMFVTRAKKKNKK